MEITSRLNWPEGPVNQNHTGAKGQYIRTKLQIEARIQNRNCKSRLEMDTLPTTKSLRFFIGLFDILGTKTSKKPIKKCNDLEVGTVLEIETHYWNPKSNLEIEHRNRTSKSKFKTRIWNSNTTLKGKIRNSSLKLEVETRDLNSKTKFESGNWNSNSKLEFESE